MDLELDLMVKVEMIGSTLEKDKHKVLQEQDKIEMVLELDLIKYLEQSIFQEFIICIYKINQEEKVYKKMIIFIYLKI